MILVKSKIVFDKKGITHYIWKKSWWLFGKWIAAGQAEIGNTHKWAHKKAERITADRLAAIVYKELINPEYPGVVNR
jgi:hypothetical protein